MNQSQLSAASTLWKGGTSGPKISDKLGISLPSLKHHIRLRRDLFPERLLPRLANKDEVNEPTGDTMVWVTETGAKVTLPRVRFLEGRHR